MTSSPALNDEATAAEALLGCGDLVLLVDVADVAGRFGETPGEYAAGSVRRFANSAADEDWLALMTALELTDDPARTCLVNMVSWSLARDRQPEPPATGSRGARLQLRRRPRVRKMILPLPQGLDGLWAGPTSPLVALVYEDGPAFDPLISALVRSWMAKGLRLAGVVQLNERREGRRRCDMILEDLSSGRRFPISEDRGAMARGCHLDHDALSRIILDVHQSLSSGVDALVVNKFGKEEAEGRGFVDTIAAAMEHGIPAVIGVPLRNLTAFRVFGEGAAEEVCVSSIRGDRAHP